MNDRETLRQAVAASSIRRVRVLAWRDLDDPEAGGSERHAHEILRRWAAAGLEIRMRTSRLGTSDSVVEREGYTVERRSGRYSVFPSALLEGLFRDRRRYDAVVEVWNGAPFFTPLWARRRLVWLHHVHGEMWKMTLGLVLAKIGWHLEHSVAPRFYRRSRVVTLSSSSRAEIEERLGLKGVSVVAPGIDERFKPGDERSETPAVVAVGRLVPVKRYDVLIKSFVEVRRQVPTATLEICGDGYLGRELGELVEQLGASSYVTFRGFVSDADLVTTYKRAWVVASASLREGWGMSLTEAAACGTPSVATDIAGHRDAVRQGESGILVSDEFLADALRQVLTDATLRARWSAGALALAGTLTWDRAALDLFEALASS